MMNNSMKKMLSVIACMVLIAAMALFATGCTDSVAETTPPTEASTEAVTEAVTEGASDVTVLGEGETVYTVVTADLDGKETTWEIHTDDATVGEALLALELIDGEMGDYGLYIKTVNGITLDYETDGKYWAFYIDGEYALTGVDSTEAAAGAVYTFKPE